MLLTLYFEYKRKLMLILMLSLQQHFQLRCFPMNGICSFVTPLFHGVPNKFPNKTPPPL